MRKGILLWMLAMAGALSGSPALAQDEVLEPAVVRNAERTVERAVFGKETGHDKCVGQGHERSGGGGHEAGECEEQEEARPSGPVSEAVCAQTIDESESAWRRYACTVSAYNENYVNRTLESNQDYPSELSAYALETDERLVAGTTVLGDAISRALPLLGGPTPGPQVDEAVEAFVTYAGDYTGSIDERFTQGSNILLAGVDEALPLLGGPTPGPQVDEIRSYVETTDDRLMAGTAVLADAVTRALPLLGGPTPGPQVTEAAESFTAYTTEYVANADERVASGSRVLLGGVNEALPLLGGPTPGPQVHDYDTSRIIAAGR